MTARWDGKDLLLAVYIQPRASRDEITGQHGEALRIRVAAPPVDGEANAALCRFLADVFDVAKSAVSVESGQSGRRKTVRIREPRVLPTEIAIPPR